MTAFLSALRRARRRPIDAVVNVLGLALGLACVGLVALHLTDEYGADRDHPGGDRAFRLVTDVTDAGGEVTAAPTVPRPVLGVVAASDPDVEATAAVAPGELRVRRPAGPQVVAALYADGGFLDVFGGYRLVEGDPATALAAPLSVVLTESAAARVLDDVSVGATLRTEDGLTYNVTGVMEDPGQGHLAFDGLISFATLEASGWDATIWHSFDLTAYVRLREGADPTAFADRVRDIVDRQSPELAQMMGGEIVVAPEPLGEIYLSTTDRLALPFEQHGRPGLLRILGLIGVVVLAVAAVNFVNLSTARSAERAREVGMRKAVGASRASLAAQFLGEAVGVAAVAGAVAVALIALAVRPYNRIADAALSPTALLSPSVLAAGLGLVVAVGLVAGAYPAAVLSRFRPADVLRGTFAAGGRGTRLRQGLVAFQFAVSTALLVGIAVIVGQLVHLRAQDPGYDRDRVLLVSAEGVGWSLLESLKGSFEQLPAVERVSLAQAPPGHAGWEAQMVQPAGAAADRTKAMEAVIADVDYADALGLRLAAGRDVSSETPTDARSAMLLNEAAARAFGWTADEAVGQRVVTQGRSPGVVVGVLEDYAHHGAAASVAPQVYYALPGVASWVVVRTAPGAQVDAFGALAGVWSERVGDTPFNVQRLDDVYDAQYRAEERLAQAFGVLAALAVIVACLGLLGLAAHTVQLRTKEIGVRKALGATVPQIVGRLSIDFVRPVVLGFVVAVPASAWLLGRWLSTFPVRVPLTPVPFAVAGLTALLLALVTVSLYTVRAAAADPSRALRSE